MKQNLAGRLGGWSARHRAVAIAGWLLFVVVAMLIGARFSQVSLADYEEGAGDSARAERILAEAGITQPAAEVVMVHSTAPGGWRGAADLVSQKVRDTGLAAASPPSMPLGRVVCRSRRREYSPGARGWKGPGFGGRRLSARAAS